MSEDDPIALVAEAHRRAKLAEERAAHYKEQWRKQRARTRMLIRTVKDRGFTADAPEGVDVPELERMLNEIRYTFTDPHALQMFQHDEDLPWECWEFQREMLAYWIFKSFEKWREEGTR